MNPAIRDPRWRFVRRRILDRDGWRCRACGAAGRLEVDHIRPIAAGGAAFDPENLQALCRGCHIAKTAGENRARRVNPVRGRDGWIKRLASWGLPDIEG